jgi:hypothetical protein
MHPRSDFVGRQERAAQLGTHAEELKVVPAHQFAPYTFSPTAEPQAQRRGARSRETGKRPVAVADVLVIGIGQALQPPSTRFRQHDTEPPRPLHARQRS